MLRLTGNAVYPASQSPNAKPTLDSTYFLVLTPDQVDYVAPANQMFSICLFLVRSFLSSESFLASDPIFSSSSGDWLLHDIVCVTDIVFLNHPLTQQLGGRGAPGGSGWGASNLPHGCRYYHDG